MQDKPVIQFPKWTNRPRIVIKFEIDEVYIGLFSLVGTFFLCVFFGRGAFSSVIITMLVSFVIIKGYLAYKKGATKGFLYHWFYSKNLIKPKENPRKYEDCKHIKNMPILPIGYETFFKD